MSNLDKIDSGEHFDRMCDIVEEAVALAVKDADPDADTLSLTIRYDQFRDVYSAVCEFVYNGEMTVIVEKDRETVAKLLAGDNSPLRWIVRAYDTDWIEVLSAEGDDWIQLNYYYDRWLPDYEEAY